jgi:hypothetical protein
MVTVNVPVVPTLLDGTSHPHSGTSTHSSTTNESNVNMDVHQETLTSLSVASNVATHLTKSTQARGVPGLHLPHVSLFLAQ